MTESIQAIGRLSAEGVFIFDRSSMKFTYVNHAFAQIFSISPEAIVSDASLLVPLIATEDVEYLRQVYDHVLSANSTERTEIRLKSGDESSRHLQCDAYLVSDHIIIGFLRDITREKQHEEYMVNYGAKKDTLLDMLAHNLSGPLHLTNNILQWMQDNYQDRVPAEVTSQLKLVQSTTQECVEIVNDFMYEEHTVSERVYVKKTRFDVMDKILSVLDKLAVTNKNKTFRLITRFTELNINTDSVKFFQAIHNLLSNSIKFTADGGTIDIIVEETPYTLILRIRDDGIGIPEEMTEYLFVKDPVSRRTGLNDEPSTGLGLGIVKTLVTLLDGKVDVESVEGEGSTFSIEIPRT